MLVEVLDLLGVDRVALDDRRGRDARAVVRVWVVVVVVATGDEAERERGERRGAGA